MLPSQHTPRLRERYPTLKSFLAGGNIYGPTVQKLEAALLGGRA